MRLPEATPENNIYTRSSIWRMFRDAADEDYLVARIAARSRLQFQFCWSSQQAIEKYLKAILLLNGRKISTNHNLLDMFGDVLEIADGLLPIVICPPNDFPRLQGLFIPSLFEPSESYIQRVERLGNPNNRYRHYSINLDFGDLNKLDQMCFLLRRVAFPLDLFVSNLDQTAREVLEKNRSLQLHPKMAFQNVSHKQGKDLIDDNFRWRNFAYFYEEAMSEGAICSGATSINSDISINLGGGRDEQLSSLYWLAENALPRKFGKALKVELEKRRGAN